MLNSKPVTDDGEFVGIDAQKEMILKLMEQEDTRLIGLWGMGGIGKTTLADAVRKEVLPKFTGHYIIWNVSDKLEKQGRESLRNDLLSKLLNQENFRVDTLLIESTLIQEMLNNKRVFVVLDDVNESDLIDYLGVKHFGHGSKILVTSRDKQVLKNGGVDKIYAVKKLNEDESLQLFSKFAFKQFEPDADLKDLTKKFVKYAHGSPLALKMLGSNLYQKPREAWESAVDKLKEYPESKILKVLKISFNGLDELEKNIFLDIACFFNRDYGDFVVKFLSCCYNGALYGIRNLVDKCLLDGDTVDKFPSSFLSKYISMHDLLQEMGRDIVWNESKGDPGKRSRLWKPKDVYHVLKYNKGTESIEGIMLDMSQIDVLQIHPTIFENMINLRFLKFYFPSTPDFKKCCNKFKGLLAFLPDELRYLRWDNYPFKSLPSNFNPKNLVQLHLRHGNLEQLWNEDHQDLVNLRQIILSDCKNLKKIPNLSGAIKLESLYCTGCESLVELLCLRDLVNLRQIALNDCKNLKKIPNLSGAIKLESIYCTRCESLVELPCLQDLVSLRRIVLRDCKNLRKIPSLLGTINLQSLDCIGCENLIELPCLNHLTSLNMLELQGCCRLKNFPNVPNNCSRLLLKNTEIEEVPDSIEHLFKLKELWMGNSRVKNVSSNISKLESFSLLDLSYCQLAKFPELPSRISIIYLCGIQIEEVPPSVGCLNELWRLDMRDSSIQNLRCNIDLPGCPKTEDVPSSVSRFKSLKDLNLNQCKSLKLLSDLPPRLEYLDASDCTSLENVSFTDQYLYNYHPLIVQDTIIFSNCFKLNQNSIDNIVVNSMLRIGSLAKLSSGNKYARLKRKKVFFCLPGNEILTKKFESQSTNSSIVFKIGLNSYSGSRLLVFALCLVVNFQHCTRDKDIEFICEYQLKARGGDYGKFKSKWLWCKQHFEPETKFLGDHMFILFSGDMVKKDEDYEEASFEFRVKTPDYYRKGTKVDDIKVDKCGVHVFYVDAESSANSDAESSQKFNSDERGNDGSEENSDIYFECNENFESEEDTNIEEVH